MRATQQVICPSSPLSASIPLISICISHSHTQYSPNPPHCRYKVMAKPLNFDIKSQEDVIKQLPPFFNMKEKSEVCCPIAPSYHSLPRTTQCLLPAPSPRAVLRTRVLLSVPRTVGPRHGPPRRASVLVLPPLPVHPLLRVLHRRAAVPGGACRSRARRFRCPLPPPPPCLCVCAFCAALLFCVFLCLIIIMC
jgi:hypothetical protein